MSGPPPMNVSGPAWSAKHHDPTVRRFRWGRARRTVTFPTCARRLSVISIGPVTSQTARDVGMSVAEQVDSDPRHEVQVLLSLLVEKQATLAAHKGDRQASARLHQVLLGELRGCWCHDPTESPSCRCRIR